MKKQFHDYLRELLLNPQSASDEQWKYSLSEDREIPLYKTHICLPERTEVTGYFTKEELSNYDGFVVGVELAKWDGLGALVGVLCVPIGRGPPYVDVKSTLNHKISSYLKSEERESLCLHKVCEQWRFYLEDSSDESLLDIERQDQDGLYFNVLKRFS